MLSGDKQGARTRKKARTATGLSPGRCVCSVRLAAKALRGTITAPRRRANWSSPLHTANHMPRTLLFAADRPAGTREALPGTMLRNFRSASSLEGPSESGPLQKLEPTNHEIRTRL